MPYLPKARRDQWQRRLPACDLINRPVLFRPITTKKVGDKIGASRIPWIPMSFRLVERLLGERTEMTLARSITWRANGWREGRERAVRPQRGLITAFYNCGNVWGRIQRWSPNFSPWDRWLGKSLKIFNTPDNIEKDKVDPSQSVRGCVGETCNWGRCKRSTIQHSSRTFELRLTLGEKISCFLCCRKRFRRRWPHSNLESAANWRLNWGWGRTRVACWCNVHKIVRLFTTSYDYCFK